VIERRVFLAGTGAVLLAMPLAAEGQRAPTQPKRYRIGYLASSPPSANARPLQAFRDGLREQGLVEGRNIDIESRWTEDSIAGLPKLAAELVGQKVDVILAWTTPVVLAAKQATATIPIVMVGVADPVASGLVAGLAHPGGNVTGVTNVSAELSSKLVEIIVQVVPRMNLLAGVRNALNPSSVQQLKETEVAVRALGLQFQLFEVRAPGDLESVFAGMAKTRATAAVFFPDPMFISQRDKIAQLAAKHRLPTIFGRRENTEAGGLISYGPDLTRQFHQAALYVGKIIKGANPSDLPVEQPTILDLVVNVKAAKALGLTIPQSLLQRADEIIQ
jgi:putative ABC transport system substrate-binding protein